MKDEAQDLWDRAEGSLRVAEAAISEDPNSAASRAYFAAFHAVSSLFLSRGTDFSKHSAVEAAVHRDLVKPGLWSKQLGADYSWLATVRSTGDYGGTLHVSKEDARSAVERAHTILDAVRATQQRSGPPSNECRGRTHEEEH